MKYKGITLKEFTSDKPVAFDPPKLMFVWDEADRIRTDNPALVYAYVPKRLMKVIVAGGSWKHCAEIPGIESCRNCKPGASNTTEQKNFNNFNYCPICGYRLNKENT